MFVCWNSKYNSGSEYPRVLNNLRFWLCLWFWMCQSFRYTRVLNMPLVLICQDFEYTSVLNMSELNMVQNRHAWIIPEYAWLFLIMSGNVWICVNMPEYAWICLNLPGWLSFTFCISAFILESLFYLNTYLLIWTSKGIRGYNLKEHETVFLKGQNLIFSIAAAGVFQLFFVLD